MSNKVNLKSCSEGDTECNKMHTEIRSQFDGKNDVPLKELYDIRTTHYYSLEIDEIIYKMFKESKDKLILIFNKGEHLGKYNSIDFINYGKILNFCNTQCLNLLLGFFQNYKSKLQYFDILINYSEKDFLLNWLNINYKMLENVIYLYMNFLKLVSKYFINMLNFVGKRNLDTYSFQEKFQYIMKIALNKSNEAQFNQYEYGMVNVAFKCIFNYSLVYNFLHSIKVDIINIKNNNKNKYDIDYYYSEFLEKLNLYGTLNEGSPYINFLLSKNPLFDVTFLNIYVDKSLKNIKIYMDSLMSKS